MFNLAEFCVSFANLFGFVFPLRRGAMVACMDVEDDNALAAAALNRTDSSAPLPALPQLKRRIRKILAQK